MRLAFIVAVLSILAACSSQETLRVDPFFGLPLAKAIEDPAPGSGPEAGPGYRVSLRVFRADERDSALNAPAIDVRAGEPAVVALTSQCSFVKTYVLETAPDAWLADPVIGTLKEGLALNLVTRPGARSDEAVLAWHARLTGSCGSLPSREVMLGDGTSSATLQLPALTRVEATGRTLVRLGEETRLGRIPAWRAGGEPTVLTLTAKVEPVDLHSPPAPDADPIDLDPILTRTNPIAARDGPVEISVVWLRSDAGARTLHLTRAVAERLLPSLGMRCHKTFTVDTAAEEGTRVACVLERAYVGDFDVEVSSTAHLVAPIVKELRVGFEARVEERNGHPALVWSLGSLASMETFTTSLGARTTPVTIQIPETTEASGVLPLRSPVNLATVAPLVSGGVIAVLVREP